MLTSRPLQLLLALPPSRGVDPSAQDNGALRWAAEAGHTSTVQFLVELSADFGVDPSARDNAALRAAAEQGHTEVVQCLLKLTARGVDPGARNHAALRCAVRRKHEDIVRMLLEAQPDLSTSCDAFTRAVEYLAELEGDVAASISS